jgi:hypothetical protein
MTRRVPYAARRSTSRHSEMAAAATARHREPQSGPSVGGSPRLREGRARVRRTIRPVILASRTVTLVLPIGSSAAPPLAAEAGIVSAANRRIFLASASSFHRMGAVRRMTFVPLSPNYCDRRQENSVARPAAL